MKIGIIGAGHIGATAAELFAKAGHAVAVSNSRGPDTLRDVVKELGPGVQATTAEEAAEFGDLVLLAIPYGVYKTLPAGALRGKIAVDASNYFPQRDGQIDFEGLTSSEVIARHLPEARVVKAFNTMNFRALATESRSGSSADERLALFVASDDAGAKEEVARLIDEIGFTAVDTGSLREGGRRQEPGSPFFGATMSAAEARAALGT
jgi:8-hydroxy-5-deazaflavin:NADPH oxidoreductase